MRSPILIYSRLQRNKQQAGSTSSSRRVLVCMYVCTCSTNTETTRLKHCCTRKESAEAVGDGGDTNPESWRPAPLFFFISEGPPLRLPFHWPGTQRSDGEKAQDLQVASERGETQGGRTPASPLICNRRGSLCFLLQCVCRFTSTTCPLDSKI